MYFPQLELLGGVQGSICFPDRKVVDAEMVDAQLRCQIVSSVTSPEVQDMHKIVVKSVESIEYDILQVGHLRRDQVKCLVQVESNLDQVLPLCFILHMLHISYIF